MFLIFNKGERRKTTIAIAIKEYVDAKFTTPVSSGEIQLTEGALALQKDNYIDPDSLMVEIEGIHASPAATRNFTRYMPKALKASVPTWTAPYRKPLIEHHNEENGQIIGRIIDAEYVTKNTLSGTPALKFTVNVPDERAKKDIKSGLLATTSIGATAHDVRCSICGSHIESAEEGCPNGHERGGRYNGETCYWDIYSIEGKELSFVVVPADPYSQKTAVYPATESTSKKPTVIKESYTEDNQEDGLSIPSEKGANMAKKEVTAEDLAAEVASLKESLDAQTKKAVELEESLKEATEKIEALEKEKVELSESAQTLEASNKDFEEALKSETALRESLEQEISDTKAQLKESVLDMYVSLRESLGYETDAEKVSSRSVESLKDSVVDLKESLSLKSAAPVVEVKEKVEVKPNSVEDPTLKESEDEDNKKISVREKIDLKSGLANLFG